MLINFHDKTALMIGPNNLLLAVKSTVFISSLKDPVKIDFAQKELDNIQ